MRINSNILAQQLSGRIFNTSRAIARSLERLSSGKRVLSAMDDVASFSTLERLKSQINGLARANEGISQAKGLLSTASAGLSSQIDIVQRMRELAIEGASSLLSSGRRSEVNSELQRLTEQFSQITHTTEFNGIHLLDGSFDPAVIQLGANAGSSLEFNLPNLGLSNVFKKDVGAGFDDPDTYSGSTAYGPEVADFNNDGILDIATLTSAFGIIQVRLGNGDGTFGSVKTSETGLSLGLAIDVADMNGDGIEDVVASAGNSVGVSYGRGDGTFESAVTASGISASLIRDVETADIDNDGDLDIVGVSSISTDIEVIMNNGDGTFSVSSSMTGGTYYGLELADLNGDGNVDLITSDFASSYIGVRMGNGDGTFASEKTVATGSNPFQVISADFNRDGVLDLASVANGSDDTVSIHLGIGNGSFQARTTYAIGDASNDLQIGDFNGDGILDIVAGSNSDDELHVHVGAGDGSFSAYDVLEVDSTIGVAAGDFNGDGVDDIASSYTGISVFIQNTQKVSAQANLQVNSASDAAQLLRVLDDTLERLSGYESDISAIYGRLDVAVVSNLLQAETLEGARETIDNPDLALETAELVRLQILQQAELAVLTQANTNARLVLSLLPQAN